jgi:rod shape determining protein RodA
MKRNIDKSIWLFTILIVGFSLIALYSASHYNVRVSHEIFYDQLFCAALGLAIMYAVGRMDYRKFYDAAYIFYGINVVLLIWVLLSGRHALGATRWIEIGSFSFQPSEVSKLALILFLGRYFSSRRPTLSFDMLSRTQVLWNDLILPFLMTAVSMLLIFKQPDLGSSL